VTGSDASPSFTLAYVPGVTPTKWVRIWNERLPDVPLELLPVPAAEAAELLRGLGADAGFVRLPVDRTELSAIPLYVETTVVVVPKDHLVTAVDEVSVADLADETVLHPLDDTLGWERLPGRPAVERPATTEDAVALVAAGVGVLVVPQSLARLHHRRDVTYRTVTDAPTSQVALSWREDATTDLVDDFIGIVRGRTVNSSRGRSSRTAAAAPSKESKEPKEKGKEKAKDMPAARKQTPKPRATSAGTPRGTSAGTPNAKGARAGSAGPKSGRRGKPRRHS